MKKSSAWAGATWRRARRICRTSSWARAKAASSPGAELMVWLKRAPSICRKTLIGMTA